MQYLILNISLINSIYAYYAHLFIFLNLFFNIYLFLFSVTPDETFHDPLRYPKFPLPGGKPLNIRRGPGRPRKERPFGITRGGGTRRSFGRGGTRGKGFV